MYEQPTYEKLNYEPTQCSSSSTSNYIDQFSRISSANNSNSTSSSTNSLDVKNIYTTIAHQPKPAEIVVTENSGKHYCSSEKYEKRIIKNTHNLDDSVGNLFTVCHKRAIHYSSVHITRGLADTGEFFVINNEKKWSIREANDCLENPCLKKSCFNGSDKKNSPFS